MSETREVSQQEARRDPDAPFVRLSRREFEAWLKIEEDRDALGHALFRLYALWSDPSNPRGEDIDALWEEIVGRFPWLEPGEQAP